MPDYETTFQHFDGEPSPEEIEGMLTGDETDASLRASLQDAFHLEYLRRTLVAARTGAGNQTSIAEVMGTSQSVVSDIETGRVDPRLSTLQRYARAVGRRLEFKLHDHTAVPPNAVAVAAAKVATGQVVGDILNVLLTREAEVGPQSPGDVAKATDQPEVMPFIRHTMHQLTENGLLDRAPGEPSAEQRFSLSEDSGSVIGISVGPRQARAVVTRLRSEEILDRAEADLDDTAPAAVERTVLDLVRTLRNRADNPADIMGLGVAMAGRIDPSNGCVLYAPDLATAGHEWRDEPLQGSLAEGTGLNCIVENDANALAIREYVRHGGRDNLAVVLMSASSEGIGAGLVVNGAIVHGIGGVAGEIGHIRVDPDGIPCRCGTGRGCLETVASEAGILRRIRYESDLAPTSLREVAALATGSSVVRDVLKRAGRALSRVLTGLAATVGPAQIVIYGPSELTAKDRYGSAQTFLSPVTQGLDEAIPGVKTDVVPRALEVDAEPLAAAAVAVREVRRRPNRWLPRIVDAVGIPWESGAQSSRSFSRTEAES
jgi:predicted NBD/HSP70 family sugar kinase/transcriptional regulator with XRE-family HTH domain